MKVKLIGKVKCLCCQWSGEPKDLIESSDWQLVKCPSCDAVMIDFTNGNFVMQNIEGDSVSITD